MESPILQASPNRPVGQPDTNAEIPSGRRRQVLIVEDNMFVAQQCQSALTAAGYEVVGVLTTAEEAIEFALQRRPAMVLMDVYLRGTRDGIEAALEIFR